MNKNQVEGRIKKIEGAAKEVAGKVSGKKGLELKGKLKKAVGEAQADYGDIKSDLEKGT